MAGRPKPTALKAIEGNRGKRKTPDNEPQPEAVIPDMPKTIDADAKRTWKKLAPMLEQLGLITEADGDMLAILCQIQARTSQIHKEMKQAKRESAKLRRLYKEYFEARELDKVKDIIMLLGDVKATIAHLMKEERQYSQLFRQYGAEFGLSPRGRTGLTVGGGKDGGGEDFLT